MDFDWTRDPFDRLITAHALYRGWRLATSDSNGIHAIVAGECKSLSNQIESDILISMKMLSVTEVARNFSAVLDSLERGQEEIILVRNRRQIARLVPEAPRQDALEVFGDLYRTMDDETAEAIAAAVSSDRKSRRGRLSELRNPWAG